MTKYLHILFFILFFSAAGNAATCTLNFSIADYGTVYDQIRYNFIPYSTVDPKSNGGGQFFVKSGTNWIASTPTKWGSQISIPMSSTTNCNDAYKQGITNIEVAYANAKNGAFTTAPTADVNSYCLARKILPAPDSQVITLPQFGPNNGYWQPCS